MFTGFMTNTWLVASIVAVIAGIVGFFVVLRGSAFAAHAIPNGAFAGAAGATLVGVNVLIGLAVVAVLAALGIGTASRRGRADAVTALALSAMLAIGAAFLSRTTEYEPEISALLFGEVLGVSSSELLPVALLGLACIVAVAVLYRPLVLTSVSTDLAATRGVRPQRIEIAFLLVLAIATAMTVPVVGALLIFTLMIGPPAAARAISARPAVSMALAVALALVVVWCSIALSYENNWPIGFYVGALSTVAYVGGRVWAAVARRRSATPPGRVQRVHAPHW